MTFSQQWIQFHNWIHMGPFAWSLVVNRGSYRRRLSSVRYGLGLVSANEFSNLVTIHTCCSFKRRMSCKPSTNEHSIRFSLLSNYCQLGLKWFWCIACQLEWRGRVCMDYTMSWTFRALAFWIWFGKSFFRSVEWVGGVQNETPFQNETLEIAPNLGFLASCLCYYAYRHFSAPWRHLRSVQGPPNDHVGLQEDVRKLKDTIKEIPGGWDLLSARELFHW